MNLSCLLSLLKEIPAYRQLVERLLTTKGERKIVMLDAARPYFIATLYEELGLPLMVITAQPEDARKLYEQLQIWCPPSANLHRFSELDFSPYKHFTFYPDAMLERLQTLASLALYQREGNPSVTVTSVLAVISKTIPEGDFASACHILKQGMTVDPLDLLHKWQNMG